MQSYNKCPKCSKELECLGGCSAHPRNWYCPDSKCGYEAWNNKGDSNANKTKQPN